jgi:hypothetical protein
MRARVAVAGIFSGALAALLAGCTINDLQYFRDGIGSELATSETLAATANEDAYIGLVCRQAGLPTEVTPDGLVLCSPSANWSLIAQAGMNDIDRRCDSYLLWLDDKRRSNEPFLKELAALSAATLGVLNATNAGVRAITITGIAFGLAANTFTNINTRLLALEQSTVQAVVLDSQRKYRANNSTAAVTNRPGAIYYLRNYLRICMPYSIETSVNNTVTVFHRAGADALRGEALFSRQLIFDPNQPFEAPGLPPPNGMPGARNNFERTSPQITPSLIASIQRTLCVGATESVLTPATRTAIGDFFEGLGRKSNSGGRIETLSGNVLSFLIQATVKFPDCPPGRTARQVGASMKTGS